MRFLLDTNIIISHFLGDDLVLSTVGKSDYFISVITEAELLRLPGLSVTELLMIEKLLDIVPSLPVDSAIARHAASLGRTRKSKLPDLLIAATALEHKLPLITKNIKDFRRIPGLALHSTIE